MKRSIKPEVRNPLLSLPAAKDLKDLPEETKKKLQKLLLEIRQDARDRAEKSWKKHKAPIAAYWKAVSVYAGHTARLLRNN